MEQATGGVLGIKNTIELAQKEFKYKLQGRSMKRKLHVSNGLERAGFRYKQFALKLIIVHIQFKVSNYLWSIRHKNLDICG